MGRRSGGGFEYDDLMPWVPCCQNNRREGDRNAVAALEAEERRAYGARRTSRQRSQPMR